MDEVLVLADMDICLHMVLSASVTNKRGVKRMRP